MFLKITEQTKADAKYQHQSQKASILRAILVRAMIYSPSIG
jgi:hypothetical protein